MHQPPAKWLWRRVVQGEWYSQCKLRRPLGDAGNSSLALRESPLPPHLPPPALEWMHISLHICWAVVHLANNLGF